MSTPIKILAHQGLAMSLYCCLFSTIAVAQEVAGVTHVPLKSMNQAEYESYHEQLDRQVRNVSKETPTQNSDMKETSADPQEDKNAGQSAASSTGSAYGKGYRARMQSGNASSGRAGGYRGGSGSVSRGGGGRYR